MSTFSKVKLSGSTDGRNVKVAATATLGTVIHTTGASALDEIWLWAVNSDTSDRKLTIEFGGVTSPDDLIEQTIAAESGLVLIVPGILLTNTKVVTAFASTANVVLINGFVNRIT